MKGGKQPGAGRPPGPPTVTVRIRLSPAQHAAYIDRGSELWLKRLLDEAQPAPTWLTSVAAELGVTNLTEAEARQAGYAPLPTKPLQPAISAAGRCTKK